jgi:hypothetical protein
MTWFHHSGAIRDRVKNEMAGTRPGHFDQSVKNRYFRREIG